MDTPIYGRISIYDVHSIMITFVVVVVVVVVVDKTIIMITLYYQVKTLIDF